MNKGFAFHSSLKDVQDNKQILGSDKQYDDDTSSYSSSESITYIENQGDYQNGSEVENSNVEKYEIQYVNPNDKKTKNEEEKSLKNEDIKNNLTINNKSKDKARSFFDKQMKFLKMKNKKLEKQRQCQENKNKELYKVFHYLNEKSKKIVDRSQKYRPLLYKSAEDYNQHLARIKINETRKKEEDN